ncbi:signal peptidase II [Patescibacteria group bacterium]|nr:signal peptidase II [Patescibacteria group bacterium]
MIRKIKFLLPALTISTLALDMLTKKIAVAYFEQPLRIIGDFVRFVYSENYGIAFSIPLKGPLLIAGNLIILALIVIMGSRYLELNQRLNSVAFALIIGGALGNIFDRITQGYVIDFIAIYKYPVFNIADVALTVGAIILAAQLIKNK